MQYSIILILVLHTTDGGTVGGNVGAKLGPMLGARVGKSVGPAAGASLGLKVGGRLRGVYACMYYSQTNIFTEAVLCKQKSNYI